MNVPSESELNEWMWRLADGNRDSFRVLYDALWKRAYAFAFRLQLKEEREDFAQAVLLQLFEKASSFEVGRPLLPWFYTLCAHELYSRNLRKQKEGVLFVPNFLVNEVSSKEEDSPEVRYVWKEAEDVFLHAMEELDSTSKETLLYYLGKSEKPVEISDEALRKRLSRTVQDFVKKLRRYYEHEL